MDVPEKNCRQVGDQHQADGIISIIYIVRNGQHNTRNSANQETYQGYIAIGVKVN